jgi:import inner membrane translocase subunit TIM16
MGNDASGVGHANTGSPTDQLTRSHRMTVDEASLILNAKKGDTMEQILKVRIINSFPLWHTLILSAQNYENLFKINSPPPAPEKSAKPAAGKKTLAYYSHYLQSKVVRARERLEAEAKLAEAPAEAEAEAPKAEDSSSSPPPPEQGKSS